MNPLYSLYRTYELAEKANMVDNHKETAEGASVLLPVYHDNKRSNGKDIIQILLDKEGKFLEASWVPEDVYIQFPVSEESIGRANGVLPHPLVDKLKYVSREMSEATAKRVSDTHHEAYREQLQDWLSYTATNPNAFLEKIGAYILHPDTDVLKDIMKSLYNKQIYSVDKQGAVHYLEDEKKKEWKAQEVFVTFAVIVEQAENDLEFNTTCTVTENTALHDNFIAYMDEKLKDKQKDYCDISGEYTYCVSKHRGLMGNAKVIGGSNRYEVYRGLYQSTDDLIRVGFKTSQKIHLMLKYLLENKDTGRRLRSGAYVVNWFSNDIENLTKFDPTAYQLSPKSGPDEEEDSDVFGDEEEDSDVSGDGKESSTLERIFAQLGSQNLGQSLTGNRKPDVEEWYNYFILLLEKTSNGRIAIKYFRKFSESEFIDILQYWNDTMNFPYYSYNNEKYRERVLPIFAIINTLYGEDTKKGYVVEGQRNKKITGNLMEDAVRCMMDRQPLPKELAMRAWANGKNRIAYKYHWQSQLYTDCIVLQKFRKDLPAHHKKYMKKEENFAMLDLKSKDRSYLYGRLLAVYDKIERDVLYSKKSAEGTEASKTSNEATRPTNAMKLWAAFIDRPSLIHLNLSKKIQPYMQSLRNTRPGSAQYYEIELTKLMNAIQEVQQKGQRESLDENFLFGYYGQMQEFYKKKPKNESEKNSKEVEQKIAAENVKEDK